MVDIVSTDLLLWDVMVSESNPCCRQVWLYTWFSLVKSFLAARNLEPELVLEYTLVAGSQVQEVSCRLVASWRAQIEPGTGLVPEEAPPETYRHYFRNM